MRSSLVALRPATTRPTTSSRSPEIVLIEAAEAQKIFDSLPGRLRVPTLSPAYVVADALRDSTLTPEFLMHGGAGGFLLHAVLEGAVPDSDFADWQSPYGYGGPLAHEL